MDWQAHLTRHVEAYASCAWYGYKHKGRGVVVADFSIADRGSSGEVIGYPMEYLTLDAPAIAERGGWPVAEVPELVERYDPEAEIVVLICVPNESGEGYVAHATRMGPLPIKEIYQKQTARQAIFGGTRER
jgi:hypothetical protein